MTTAFFLRHGPTRENKENRIQGQQHGTIELPDTERYIAAVVPLLRKAQPNVILSSDLERAVRTRDVLRAFLQIPLARDGSLPMLRERAMGYYEGMLERDVPESFRRELESHNYDFRKFGGENSDDVRERVRLTLKMLNTDYKQSRVACITHAEWLHQLVYLADEDGIFNDDWSNREAIYSADIGPEGTLERFDTILIEAGINLR